MRPKLRYFGRLQQWSSEHYLDRALKVEVRPARPHAHSEIGAVGPEGLRARSELADEEDVKAEKTEEAERQNPI